MYDTIIIGAGPAGLTAAIYLLRASKKVLLLEKEGIGGQMASSPLIENYPGIKSISGSDLANNLFEQVLELGGDFEVEEVKKITKNKEIVTDSNTYKAKSIIIATGCKHRTLCIDDEDNLIGKGIHFCVSCDGAFYKNKTVIVVGGGNSAIINAISLSEICKKVIIIQLLDHLTAEDKLIKEIELKPNIEIILNATITSYLGKDELNGVEILTNNQKNIINADGLFLSIGLIPANNVFKDIIKITNDGYIDSNDGITNIDGIFVSGDIRKKAIRQITTATSDGTIAAINAINYLRKD